MPMLLVANWTEDWLSARLRVFRGALIVLDESCIAPPCFHGSTLARAPG